jgi:acetyl-CoA synthetase
MMGHLVCRQPAPSMTKSFLHDDARYLETYFQKFPGVWYHGDWAKVDEDGRWFLFGRTDDTMKVAGKRVGPGEVESALTAHPAVSEAAVIGVPHPDFGEAVVAVVVPEVDSSRDGTAIVAKTCDVLAKFKTPKQVFFIDELPRNTMGKVQKNVLRDRYAATFATATVK